MERVVCSWSGGKESTLALESIMTETTFEVSRLMTTASEGHDRMSIHGVRLDVLQQQADALGIPLDIVRIPRDATGADYIELMTETFSGYADRGLSRLVLGDVFLEDDDDYRGEAVDRSQIYCPLLGEDTEKLVRRFVDRGYEALTVAVDGELGSEFVGRTVDEEFLAELPADADLAGEDGEYHTFVLDGPIFDHPVGVEPGEVVDREIATGRMVYQDLLPTEREDPK